MESRDIQGNDTKKFVDFLQDIGIEEFNVPLDTINIRVDINSFEPDIAIDTGMLFEYTDVYGGHVTGRVWLDTKKKIGQLSMGVLNDVETGIAQRDLVIKVENGNVYVYRNQ